MRHIAHYPGQHAHPLLTKAAEVGSGEVVRYEVVYFPQIFSDDDAVVLATFEDADEAYDYWFESSRDRALGTSLFEVFADGTTKNVMSGDPNPRSYSASRKTAYADFDLSEMPTIDPSTGRFRPTYPGGGNPNLRGVKPLAYVEEYISDAVSFTPTVEYTEPKTVSVHHRMTGWSAKVDASKEGWAVRLLEKAEAYSEKYEAEYLTRNSDFSIYRASRNASLRKRSSRIFDMNYVNDLERRVNAAFSELEKFVDANEAVGQAYDDLASADWEDMNASMFQSYRRALDARDQAFNRWQSANDPIANELKSMESGAISVGSDKGSTTEEFKAYVEAVDDLFGSARQFFEDRAGVVHNMMTAEEAYTGRMEGMSYSRAAQEERRGVDALEKEYKRYEQEMKNADEDEGVDFYSSPEDFLIAPEMFDQYDLSGDSGMFGEWRSDLKLLDDEAKRIAQQNAQEQADFIEDLRY